MPTQTFHNLDDEKKQRIITAAVDEFAEWTYNEVKLSNIIKIAKIPRGSFYQYFTDKKDLYKYVFDIIAKEKIKYLGDLVPNPQKTPFLDLFYEMYVRGLEFATSKPQYIRIGKQMLLQRGEIYNELVGDNMEMAMKFFVGYIESDKALGRIRSDVDSSLLADICIQSINTIAFDELSNKDTVDKEKMLNRVKGMLKILKKGIE